MSEPTLASPAAPLFTIGQVVERTGLSEHTLRFYEREDLFADPVARDRGGRRMFTEQQVEWLRVCSKLRSSGMPLPAIHRYVELFRQGPGTVAERYEVLREHEAAVRRQMADLEDALATITHKVEMYAARLEAGTADNLWAHGPECH